MKTLEMIYWLRLALGITAALICIGFGLATDPIVKEGYDFTTFLNGLSITLVIYLTSYYIIKSKYSLKVEKPQKLLTTGIGIYFISWIAVWALLYTVIVAAVA